MSHLLANAVTSNIVPRSKGMMYQPSVFVRRRGLARPLARNANPRNCNGSLKNMSSTRRFFVRFFFQSEKSFTFALVSADDADRHNFSTVRTPLKKTSVVTGYSSEIANFSTSSSLCWRRHPERGAHLLVTESFNIYDYEFGVDMLSDVSDVLMTHFVISGLFLTIILRQFISERTKSIGLKSITTTYSY
mgnify:CR=1 FL=1